MEKRNKEMKFEEAILRLEEIVEKMESRELSLDESLEIFQEGMELAAFCNKRLEEAERKLSIITKGLQGQTVEEEFKPGEE